MTTEPKAPDNKLYWTLRDICNALGISAMKCEKYYLEEHEMISAIISAIRYLVRSNKQMATRIRELDAKNEELAQTDLFTR